MRYMARFLLIAASIGLAASPVPASARERCTEGHTASGACINPHLAKLMRRQSILMTQPKLSYTSPPVLPGDDEVVLPPRQIFETLSIVSPGRIR